MNILTVLRLFDTASSPLILQLIIAHDAFIGIKILLLLFKYAY